MSTKTVPEMFGENVFDDRVMSMRSVHFKNMTFFWSANSLKRTNAMQN